MESNSDYAAFRSAFRIEDLAAQLSGDLQTGLNVCVECCDRHAVTGKVALYWEGKDGRSDSYTFADLQELSARFANFLRARGIGPGDRVAGLLPRTPELLVVVLGTLRAGAVYQALFTAFGPKAIEYRLERGQARLIVTDVENRSKLNGVSTLPDVMTVVGNASGEKDVEDALPDGDYDFWREVSQQAAAFLAQLGTQKALRSRCRRCCLFSPTCILASGCAKMTPIGTSQTRAGRTACTAG